MTPLKMFSWLARVLWLLALAAGATALDAATSPADPLVGDWFYYQNHPVKFNADGTVDWEGGGHGTWEYLRNPEVQRHYRIVWGQGKSIDNLILAEDGKRAHVVNQLPPRNQYDVRRAVPDKSATVGSATPAAAATAGPPDPKDPIIGDWIWDQYGPSTFHADGTVTSPRKGRYGVWQSLHNPEAARKYIVIWENGRLIDTLTYVPNAPSGHVRGKRGAEYEVQRATPGSSTPGNSSQASPTPPAGYFGEPGH